MSLQRIVINAPLISATSMADVCNLRPGANQAVVNLSNFIKAIAGGTYSGTVTSAIGVTSAAGTAVFTSVIATDVFTVNGQAFTCVANGATANQFNVGGSDTITAANAAAAINASTAAAGIYTASSSGSTVTITAAVPGAIGNAITLTSSDGTIVVSGAKLSGGTNGTSYVMDLA